MRQFTTIERILMRRELIKYSANNGLRIVQCDNETFHAEDSHSELWIDVGHILMSVLYQGWTVDEVCQNESCCKVDSNGDAL